MNKAVLYLPKKLLQSYIIKNFSKFTVEEYFLLVKNGNSIPPYLFPQNEIISKNTEVLLNELEKNDFIITYFNDEAITGEVIDFIIEKNLSVTRTQLNLKPVLKNNKKLRNHLIKKGTLTLDDLDMNDLDDELADVLYDNNFVPTTKDLVDYPILRKNSGLVKRCISHEPRAIMILDNITEEYISIAVSHGFIAKKEDYLRRPTLQKYEELLHESYNYDKSVVAFMSKDMITYFIESDFYKSGITLTEEELNANPDLFYFGKIVSRTIVEHPELIKKIKEKCYIGTDALDYVLSQVEITEEDFYNNPDLAKSAELIFRLPEFKLFYYYLDDKEKEMALTEYLKEGKDITTLPFLNPIFTGKIPLDQISRMKSLIETKVDESNIDVQKYYSDILDSLIDGTINIKYYQQKSTYRYPDLVSLNDDVLYAFEKGTKEALDNLINDIYMFTRHTIDIEEIREKIYEFQREYNETHELNPDITLDFYNKVLNQHRNAFMSSHKQTIIDNISYKIELTDKKKQTIINGKKLELVTKFISHYDYEKLSTSIEEIKQKEDVAIQTILNNKDIKKNHSYITEGMLRRLNIIFQTRGIITKEDVMEKLNIEDKEAVTFIVKQYDKIRMELSQNIEYTPSITLPDIRKIGGLNYTNFKIADNTRMYANLSRILINLDEETVKEILSNEHIEEILPLIHFINVTTELNSVTFINILRSYDRVREKIASAKHIEDDGDLSIEILSSIDDVIFLANAYASVNDITKYAFKESTLDLLDDYDLARYAEFYTKTLSRQTSNIPYINVTTDITSYVSGDYTDTDRLAIGKKPANDSCIDLLNSAGRSTYLECLGKETGDVIMVRNQMNKSFDNRILIFRRGNVVQLVPKAGSRSTVSAQDLKLIADQIMNEAIRHNDNIDYVIVNGKYEGFEVIEEARLISEFPHADVFKEGTILCSKEEKPEFDFKAEPKVTYRKPRKKLNTSPTELEITRIKALDILLTENKSLKEEKSRSFEPFYMKEYIKVICNEEFYIAVKKDGTLEELILPTASEEALIEMEEVRRLLTGEETLKR